MMGRLNRTMMRSNQSFYNTIDQNQKLLAALYTDPPNRGENEPMDEQNTLVWAKAKMSNFGTKMAELNYDLPKRQHQELVKAFLTVNKGASRDQLNREFLFQSQKMLSDENVQLVMQKLEQQIFYVPSESFRRKFGNDWRQKIIRAVAMKEPVLYRQIKSSNGSVSPFYSEVEYIHQNVWPWGSYLIDLNKFQKYYDDKFAQKSGSSTDKNFSLPFYDLEFRVKDKAITVKYKDSEIGPFQLSTIHMRTMAVDNIKSRIQGLIESFAKFSKKKYQAYQDVQ